MTHQKQNGRMEKKEGGKEGGRKAEVLRAG